jgi:pSer/pThr/pTyr-binding forkhead associated (FHA) protein
MQTVQNSEPVMVAQWRLESFGTGFGTVVLEDFPVYIGRGAGADIRVEDVYVSRLHCEIIARDGNLVVNDLNSKNGTFVNGVRMETSILCEDDIFSLGESHFVIRQISNAGAESVVNKEQCNP